MEYEGVHIHNEWIINVTQDSNDDSSSHGEEFIIIHNYKTKQKNTEIRNTNLFYCHVTDKFVDPYLHAWGAVLIFFMLCKPGNTETVYR